MFSKKYTPPNKYLVFWLAVVCMFAVVMCTGCTAMNEFGYKHEQGLRIAYHATNVADAGLTMSRDPACMSESNPFLGSDPSDGRVALFAGLSSLIYEGFYTYIKENEPEQMPAFQWAFLIVKGLAAGWDADKIAEGCN